MDIEGGEMDAIEDILEGNTGIGQLLVEFHYNYPTIHFDSFVEKVNTLRSSGFRIFHVSERGYEYSFIHRSLCEAVQ